MLSLWTVIPVPVSKPCMLGYYAHRSFTSLSTLIYWVIARVAYWMGRKAKRRAD